MEDNYDRFAVFCTANIPNNTLESFLVGSEQSPYALQYEDSIDASKCFVLITSKDLSAIHGGMSSPIQPFASPFIGQTIEEIVAWFRENISDPEAKGYDDSCFILFNSESLEEEVCTVVSLNEDPYESVRCDFTMAIVIANLVSVGKGMDDTDARCFKNSGVIMTEEGYDIVSNGGMYLDGMEVKYDEGWREFIRDWS